MVNTELINSATIQATEETIPNEILSGVELFRKLTANAENIPTPANDPNNLMSGVPPGQLPLIINAAMRAVPITRHDAIQKFMLSLNPVSPGLLTVSGARVKISP